MPLTKEQLAAELAKKEGAELPDKLFTQEDLNELLGKRIAAEKKKQEAVEKKVADLEAAHAALQAQLETQTAEQDTKGKSELEKYQADLAREKKAREFLEKEKADATAKLQNLHAAQLNTFREDKLRNLLIKADVDPNQLEDALLIADRVLADALKVEEDNGALKIKAINPLTLEAKEAAEVVKEFLATRPNLKRAKPGGGGSPQARSGDKPPSKPWTDGKSDPVQWGEAMKEFVKGKPGAQQDPASKRLLEQYERALREESGGK